MNQCSHEYMPQNPPGKGNIILKTTSAGAVQMSSFRPILVDISTDGMEFTYFQERP